jgi:hypothetical protein
MPEFHAAFTAAIYGDDAALKAWVAEADMHRLSVYRNTAFKGLRDAVMAAFPTLGKCLPDETFGALALAFARTAAPSTPMLINYGGGFADWFAATQIGQSEPHLVDMVRLDRLWTEAHLAADGDLLQLEDLAAWTPEDYAQRTFGLIPSVRLAHFDTGLPSLWAELRSNDVHDELVLQPDNEALLIWRPDEEVTWRVLKIATYRFLAALQAGNTMTDAVAEVSAHDPNTDVAKLFAEILALRVLRAA